MTVALYHFLILKTVFDIKFSVCLKDCLAINHKSSITLLLPVSFVATLSDAVFDWATDAFWSLTLSPASNAGLPK